MLCFFFKMLYDMNMNMGNPMFYNTMRNDTNFMNRFVKKSEIYIY